MKDATGDAARPTRLLNGLGDDFAQLRAKMPQHCLIWQLAVMAVFRGLKYRPALCAQMHEAFAKGDIATAQKINRQIMPLHDGMFTEASPGPVKYAAQLLGLCEADTRLPLVEISDASKRVVEAALSAAKLR